MRQCGQIGVILAAALCMFTRAALGQCCGDCNNDGTVTVPEIITSVNNALEVNATLGGCPVCVNLTAQILATGQTRCYDAFGNEINCTATGQDGDLRRGAVRSYTDNGDGTITDNATGLMWEAKDDNNVGGLHDKDDTYAWDGAFQFVAQLNATKFAGHSDWRLPNRFELESIVDVERTSPAVDPVFNTACMPACTGAACSCTAPAAYWSSTTNRRDTRRAWWIGFMDPGVNPNPKSELLAVRAVRSASAELPGCVKPRQ